MADSSRRELFERGSETIYFENCGILPDDSNHRISLYDETKTPITNSTSTFASLSQTPDLDPMTWGEDGYLSSITRKDSYGRKAKFFRICCGYLGADSIITVGVPIDAEPSNSYSISISADNAAYSNTETSIAEGSSYTNIITPNDGYSIDSVTVTMGGSDITSSAYSNGTITIDAVIGDIVIIVVTNAVATTYNNLVKSATAPVSAGNVMSTEIYNGGSGYKNGTRISGFSDSARDGYVATGMILWAKKADGTYPVLYIKGATLDTSDAYVRCTFAQTNTATDLAIKMTKVIEPANSNQSKWEDVFDIETLGTNYYKLTVKDGVTFSGFTCAFRMSLLGTGENLIITADQEIN